MVTLTSPLLTRKQAAEFLGTSEQTLANWASTGRGGLPMVRLSNRLIRYRREDLEKFIAGRVVLHTGEPIPAGI
jgi:excisionase family DNA binding protein